jgi:hypothetical protein
MRSLIPRLGETKTSKRLDELFNRKTLGSVLFGGHVNKFFEKVYQLIAFTILLNVLGVSLEKSLAISVSLLVMWLCGLMAVLYLFVRWEEIVSAAEDAAEKVKQE